jgi:hypothetical protein
MSKPVVPGSVEWLIAFRARANAPLKPIPKLWTKSGIPPAEPHKADPAIGKLKHANVHGDPCPYCGKPMLIGTLHQPSSEHVYPRHLGGALRGSNKLIVCAPCNRDKGGMILDEFAKELGWNGDARAERVRAIAGSRTEAPVKDTWLDGWTTVRRA